MVTNLLISILFFVLLGIVYIGIRYLLKKSTSKTLKAEIDILEDDIRDVEQDLAHSISVQGQDVYNQKLENILKSHNRRLHTLKVLYKIVQWFI